MRSRTYHAKGDPTELHKTKANHGTDISLGTLVQPAPEVSARSATSEVLCLDVQFLAVLSNATFAAYAGKLLSKNKQQAKFVGEIPDSGPEVVAYPTDQRLHVKALKAETVKKKSGRRSRW